MLGRKIATGKGLREDEWGGAGSEALSDVRRERYCQLIAGGCEEVEAYWKSHKDSCGLVRTKRSSAIRENSRLKVRPEVKARIEWLQGEQRKEAKLGKREKLVITEEVISGLRADFKAGERGKTVTDLMAALQRHDQMTGDGGTPVLEIRLDFGGLLDGVEKLVEGRLSGRIPKPAEGEVIEL